MPLSPPISTSLMHCQLQLPQTHPPWGHTPVDTCVRQGDITGTEKPVMLGKTILQQPVHTETWKPEEGGGTLQLMTLCHRDPGVHGFCVAIEGGSWLVEECEVSADFFFISLILFIMRIAIPSKGCRVACTNTRHIGGGGESDMDDSDEVVDDVHHFLFCNITHTHRDT